MKQLLHFLLLCCTAGSVTATEFSNDTGWEARRRQALDRPRHVIYNNDGDDATWYPNNLPVTPENFLARRLRTMENSQVESMFYVTQISFTTTTYDSKIGKIMSRNTQTDANDAANARLLAQGADPFRLAVDYCKTNGKEIFASFRMNDIHDSWWAPGETRRWVWLFPEFKRQHPELLFGTQGKRPPYGAWSAVDYEAPLVRETFIKLVREVCENYEMDGIEFDFFRWPHLFKSVAWGAEATDAQRDLLTDTFRQIREIAEAAGRRRGRPILLAVRVPDSVDYCRGIGIDLERWMSEKLIDIMVGGGNMQLAPWEESVELCHRYGLKFYPSLDMPQFDEPSSVLYRDAFKVWHARQAAALAAGVDGLYYFNVFTDQRVKQLMLGSPESIRYQDKRYFITNVLIDTPNKFLANGERYNRLPRLSYLEPLKLQPGERRRFELAFGDDLAALAAEGKAPAVTAILRGTVGAESRLTITINGKALTETGTGRDCRFYQVPADALKPGRNTVEFSADGGRAAVPDQLIVSGTELLKGQKQPPWRRLYTAHNFAESEAIVDGAYRLTDSGSGDGDIANLLYPIYGTAPVMTAKFEAKLLHADNERSAVVRFADGRHVELVSLQPEKVALLNGKAEAAFDTTGDFHRYELRMDGKESTLIVDGRELLRAPARVRVNTPEGDLTGFSYSIEKMNDSSFLFGSLSGPGTGSALWRNCRVSEPVGAATILDFAVDVTFPNQCGEALSSATRQQPFNLVNYRADDGVPGGKEYHTTYEKQFARIENGALTLNNDNPGKKFQLFRRNDRAKLFPQGKPLVTAEFDVEIVRGAGGESSFNFALTPPTARGGAIPFVVKVAADGVAVDGWGEFPLSEQRGKRCFRLELDTDDGTANLLADGQLIGSGTLPAAASARPDFWFGDGAGKTAGEARLYGFRIGATERKQP